MCASITLDGVFAPLDLYKHVLMVVLTALAIRHRLVLMMDQLVLIAIRATRPAIIIVAQRFHVAIAPLVLLRIGAIGQIGALVLSPAAVARKLGRAVAKARFLVVDQIIVPVNLQTANAAISKLAARPLILIGAVGQTLAVVRFLAAAAPRHSLVPAKAQPRVAALIIVPAHLRKL